MDREEKFLIGPICVSIDETALNFPVVYSKGAAVFCVAATIEET